jgi:5-methylthioadenosine/S-adenosylhomocysteine deaminase
VPAVPAPLLPKPLVVTGHLVTFDEHHPQFPEGALYIDNMGLIQGVAKAPDPPPPGFEDANHIHTSDYVYPGLIDLHNHVAYNCLSLWVPEDRTTPWTSRAQWPDDPEYKPKISLPANALCKAAGKAVLKYVETKAVLGGVTAIQGSAKTSYPYEGWMVRNVEYETFRTGERTVNQSVRAISSASGYAAAKADLDKGHAVLYHLAEGTDSDLVSDYEGLASHDCIRPRFGGIHSTALDEAQFADWDPRGGSIIWSPFSNLWLYGQTTKVDRAKQAGIRVCLGNDWSPSGSKNLLGELKVADLYNRQELGSEFTPHQLCQMVTSNPADALGWEDKLGRLKTGLHGDFLITLRRDDDPYKSLIAATERDVQLVAINGYPMYGMSTLMRAGAAVNPEPLHAGRLSRLVTLRDERIKDADMSWPEVIEALAAVRDDAAAAHAEAVARAGGEHQHLSLIPDKTWDNPHEDGPVVDLSAVEIPPIDPLLPDADFFAAIAKATFHDHRLDGLSRYYGR